MGKVYEALRRAEEQRSQRIQPTADSAAAVPAPEAAEEVVQTPVRARKTGSRLASLRMGSAEAAPESAGELNKRRIALLQPESFVAEQFRTLRARLDSLAATRPVGTIAMTSARRGDGKTLAAISLAAVTAMQPGRRVLLVDGDLRSPSVAASLGLRVDAGLAEVLSGGAGLEEATCRADGVELDVLAVRSLPKNPSELLASDAMSQLMSEVASAYDRVIVDLPPTLGLPDAKTVAELCDGVVFMVRANHTPAPDVEAAIEILDRNRVVGLVMNGAAQEGAPYLQG